MDLMAAARDAPHDEILVESCTSRHRLQSGLLCSGISSVLMSRYDKTLSCGHLRSRIGCPFSCRVLRQDTPGRPVFFAIGFLS